VIPNPTQSWWSARPEPVPPSWARKGVLARCKIPTLLKGQGGHRCFFRVFLWQDVQEFRAWWGDGTKPNGGFRPTPTRFKGTQVKPSSCLGTLHLVASKVTVEAVAHECCHVLVRRLQAERPTAAKVLEQAEGEQFWSGRADEEVCYDLGHWVAAIRSWLETKHHFGNEGASRPAQQFRWRRVFSFCGPEFVVTRCTRTQQGVW